MNILMKAFNRPEPIYCKHCGHKLAPNNEITSYDEQTGQPYQPFLAQKVCPNPYCGGKDYGW